MADKQPEAHRLYQFLLDRQTHLGPSRSRSHQEQAWDGYKDAADLLVSQHALIADLVGALENLTLNISEAMKTGGWVPSPLHASFFEAMSEADDALAKAKEQQ